MIREKAVAELDTWICDAWNSLFFAFANGILKDKEAVASAISLLWSNGQVEGQINKLKLVKRQMYGCGKLDLLEARLIGGIIEDHHRKCIRPNIPHRNAAFFIGVHFERNKAATKRNEAIVVAIFVIVRESCENQRYGRCCSVP